MRIILIFFLLQLTVACGVGKVSPSLTPEQIESNAKAFKAMNYCNKVAKFEFGTSEYNSCMANPRSGMETSRLQPSQNVKKSENSKLIETALPQASSIKRVDVIQDGKSSPVSAIDAAKAKCLDIGFKSGTDAFGKCVLRLSK